MKYTIEILQDAVNKSTTMVGVMQHLGIHYISGGMHAHLTKQIKKFGINTSHFVQVATALQEHAYRVEELTTDAILVLDRRNGHKEKKNVLLRAMLAIGHKYECANCQIIQWRNKELKLHIEHKDGNCLNNTRDNLCLLCPNCHSQTDTYAVPVAQRGKPRRNEKSQVKPVKVRKLYYCTCGVQIAYGSKTCRKCHNHKNKHPPKYTTEHLQQLVVQFNGNKVAMAKHLGVSDKMIAKHLARHNIIVPTNFHPYILLPAKHETIKANSLPA